MSEILRYSPEVRRRPIELNQNEKAQLNAIIDLLIPADEHFPPPSSLHLIDDFLQHLIPDFENKATLRLKEKRLHDLLRDLNTAAEGNFCKAGLDIQQKLLRRLELRDPAFFQELWTLANHSYYARLATRWQPTPAHSIAHPTPH